MGSESAPVVSKLIERFMAQKAIEEKRDAKK
jgi:hypothetical protein